MIFKRRNFLFIVLALLVAAGGYLAGRLQSTPLFDRSEPSRIQDDQAEPETARPIPCETQVARADARTQDGQAEPEAAKAKPCETQAAKADPRPKVTGGAVCLVAGDQKAPTSSAPTPVVPARLSNPRRTDVVNVVKRCGGAVVNIHCERTSTEAPAVGEVFGLAPSQSRTNGMGTGIIIDPRGYIITNHHVIEDVNVIRVGLHDGTATNAHVVARDTEVDLALLKIDISRPLPVMPLGTANDLMVGETVVAVGNAYGYPDTVSVGVISAIKRDVTLNKDMTYKSLIQTDAAVNPGNSGGPLLNVNGELIGVNVAIRAGSQRIAFAIPVDTVLHAAAKMMSTCKHNGTSHGMIVRDDVLVPEESGHDDVRPAQMPSAAGLALRRLVVERLETDSPAAKAGLHRGDIITQVDDTQICCALELERALLDHTAGDRMALAVRRGGHEEHLELVLQAVEHTVPEPADLVWRKIGLKLSPVPAEQVARANQQLHGGMAVLEVRPDSPAGKAGIQRGDVLIGLHQWEILTVDNAAFVLTHAELASFSPLRFFIVRSGQVHRGWIQQIDD